MSGSGLAGEGGSTGVNRSFDTSDTILPPGESTGVIESAIEQVGMEAAETMASTSGSQNGEPRARRSRDPYGRSRRDRGERSEQRDDAGQQAEPAEIEAPSQGGIFDSFRAPQSSAANRSEMSDAGTGGLQSDHAARPDTGNPASASHDETSRNSSSARQPREQRAPRPPRGEQYAEVRETANQPQAGAPTPRPVNDQEWRQPREVNHAPSEPHDHALDRPANSATARIDNPMPTATAAIGAPAAARAALAESPERPEPAPSGGPAFTLPVERLEQIADRSGLQWVNSDSAKVQAAQQAASSEPTAARIPRERPVVAAPVAEPLVLVETKRDLESMKLPFEKTQQPPAA